MMLTWLVVLLLVPAAISAHDHTLARCLPGNWVKLGESINANGTISEAYDRNGDLRIDTEAVSSLDGVGSAHSHQPFLYLFDWDFDGVPNEAWVDILGDESCDGFRPYLVWPHPLPHDPPRVSTVDAAP